MSISGLIILLVLLVLALYSILTSKGLKRHMIKNTATAYAILLGLLAVTRINRCDIIAVYIGLLTVAIAVGSIYFYKKDYRKSSILLVLALVIGTLGAYLSYFD